MGDKTVTCECGLTWELRKIKTIMRDKDSLNCDCGRELIEWNGGHMWTGEIVSKEESN
jgi:hypothetical protein